MSSVTPTSLKALQQQLPALSPEAAAKAAGLHYVSDALQGIRRVRSGRGFRYVASDGVAVRDKETLRRIRSLVIPPAWREVWICPLAEGHLQAVGRDARGRKQYRYHPKWRAHRDETKYDKMIAFGIALPLIRKRVHADLALPGLSRDKVLATVVRLLETTLIRVGNEEYAKENRSFGLTTLRNRHVSVSGATLDFQFRGKSGVRHSIHVHDPRLARIVKRCQELPGQELFQFIDEEGGRHSIDSSDVNEYLHRIAGDAFTAKDFRTWAGTVLAARALRELTSFNSRTQAKRNVVRAIESVSMRLGNTRAVCRKCYVHPAVIDSYLDGSLLHTLQLKVRRELKRRLHDLTPEEAAVLAFLRQGLKQEAKAQRRRASRLRKAPALRRAA